MKSLAALISITALAAGLAACSSSSTPSSSSASGGHKTGTEVAYGKVTGAAAMATSPTFHLKLTGPVTTTATTSLGGAPKQGASHTIKTGQGNLTLKLSGSGKTSGAIQDPTTCKFAYTTKVPVAVDGAMSTGKFAGATGAGHAAVVFSGNLPKLSNGKCDMSRNAAPNPKTAAGTFAVMVKMTVKH
jgi:hypothetical protein